MPLTQTPAPTYSTTTGESLWGGETIEYRGTRYLVVKANPVNLRLQNEAGKQYNLARRSRLTIITDPALQVAPKAREVAPGVVAQERHIADLVFINKHAGRYADTRQYVALKHQRQTDRWDVALVNGHGTGHIRVPAAWLTDYPA